LVGGTEDPDPDPRELLLAANKLRFLPKLASEEAEGTAGSGSTGVQRCW